MKRNHKQELKGAVRELRKDNWFLTKEKFTKQKEEDEERDVKRRKIMYVILGLVRSLQQEYVRDGSVGCQESGEDDEEGKETFQILNINGHFCKRAVVFVC